MNPNRVDFLIDIAYGVLLLVSIVLIVSVGTGIGIAFGLGALVAYIVHVTWKMARFDPQWMEFEVAEKVGEQVAQEVTQNVEETVAQEVTQNVEATLSEDIDSIIDRLEEVNERIDRRPRKDEIEESVVEGADDAADERDGESTADGGR